MNSSTIPSLSILRNPSFIALDFETANRAGGVSACQLALIKVDQGQLVDQLVTFIKPPREFRHFEFTWLHGISAADVEHSPTWDQLAREITDFIGAYPLWAHNSTFDHKVFKALDSYWGTRTAPKNIFCTYRTAKKLRPGLVNYKLPTVTRAFAPDFTFTHHRADDDALACAQIVLGLNNLVSS